jgi:hypothetical protein
MMNAKIKVKKNISFQSEIGKEKEPLLKILAKSFFS